MADSNQGRKPSQRERKPAQAKKKPETKFPLQYHKGSGNYRKKIKGKDYYFGKDPDAALKAYQEFKNAPDDDGSRTPRDRDDCELLYLVNHFLTSKAAKVDSKEITNRQFRDYKKTAERMLKHLGKSTSVSGIRPTDLDRLRRALSKTLGLVALGNEVTRVRSILLYASENSLIKHPLKFGDFKRPKKDAIELAKLDNGPRMFEADEICKLLAIAEVQMKCMILLGINAGIGNSDIGRLPVKVIDFQSGWLVYPRRKNARERRVPLWQETIAAIRDVMNAKKKDDDLLFRTRQGNPWFNNSGGCSVSTEFRKLCKKAGVHQPGRSFYGLRHSFQTIGDEIGDYLAVSKCMGHADTTISAHYRERFSDERLRAVVDHVRGWLFGTEAAEGQVAQ